MMCLSPGRGLPGKGQSRMAGAEVQTTTQTTKNGGKHMETTDKYVGLDVHKDTAVARVLNRFQPSPVLEFFHGSGRAFARRL